MKIYNTTTEELADLVHTYYNTDVASDIVGSTGDYNYNEDEDAYEMTADDLDWWESYFCKDAAYITAKNALDFELGADDRDRLFDDICEAIAGLEMEDQPVEAMAVVRRWDDRREKCPSN